MGAWKRHGSGDSTGSSCSPQLSEGGEGAQQPGGGFWGLLSTAKGAGALMAGSGGWRHLWNIGGHCLPPARLQMVRRHPAGGSPGLTSVLTPELNLHPCKGKAKETGLRTLQVRGRCPPRMMGNGPDMRI